MATRKQKVIPIFTTCESCVYCIADAEDVGHDPGYYCYFNPPVVLEDGQGLFAVRPHISKNDHICGQFKGKQ